jgi:hypothetical protein
MVDQREYVNQETLDNDHLRVRFSFTLLAAVTVLASPALCPAQVSSSAEGGAGLDPATVGTALRREAAGRPARCSDCATSE